MSVLFKALQRAEKLRGDAAGGTGQDGPADGGAGAATASGGGSVGGGSLGGRWSSGARQRIFTRRASRGRALVRGLGLGLLVALGVSMAGLLLYSEELEEVATALLVGDPPVQPWQPVETLPAPVPEETPVISTEPEAVTVVVDAPADAILDETITTLAENVLAEDTLAEDDGFAPPPAAEDLLDSTDIAALMAAGRANAEGGPPQPRALDDVLSDRSRQDMARAVAPVVTIDRPEARRAGAPHAVSVAVPTRQANDTLASSYRALLRGEHNAALVGYDAVLADDPGSAAGWLGRAAALHKLRRLDEAQESYQRVLAIEPTNREALTNLLSIIGTAAPNEALRRLEALERAAPDFTPVIAQIGLVYGQMGMTAQATGYLSRAVAQDPDNLLYRYNLAILLDRAGDRAAATRAYRAVMEVARATGRGETGSAADVPLDAVRARLDFLSAQR